MSGLTGKTDSYFTVSEQLKPILDCLPMKPVMHCIVLFCFVLFYSILFYSILFYSILALMTKNRITSFRKTGFTGGGLCLRPTI
jgi:hypothetical protein